MKNNNIPPMPSALFCMQCGHKVSHKVPAGDHHVRAVCPQCATIHYDNPKCVVGTIAQFEGKILLCRRDIEPARGLWTLPAGFLECNETLAQGAWRETFEEACAQTDLIEPVYALIDIPHISQIHVFFRATLKENPHDAMFAAGEETQEARLFAIKDIPWDEVAFRSVRWALEAFIQDSAHGVFATRHHILAPTQTI
jgi:ADP-ribose pyrophosphatase YjhB (NUDIX family)